ncbi:hypothetical protein ACIQUO_07900 [Streptomyces albogriseolus]|uniref:hypothetical protein n=1 Tax=Streptomyces albogriseolus TaxID=1887 RepID=UPI0034613645
MTESDVILNELAQGLRLLSQVIEWSDGLSPESGLRHRCSSAVTASELAPSSRMDRRASAVPDRA